MKNHAVNGQVAPSVEMVRSRGALIKALLSLAMGGFAIGTGEFVPTRHMGSAYPFLLPDI